MYSESNRFLNLIGMTSYCTVASAVCSFTPHYDVAIHQGDLTVLLAPRLSASQPHVCWAAFVQKRWLTLSLDHWGEGWGWAFFHLHKEWYRIQVALIGSFTATAEEYSIVWIYSSSPVDGCVGSTCFAVKNSMSLNLLGLVFLHTCKI